MHGDDDGGLDVLIGRLGASAAEPIAASLAAHGLAAIDGEELARLRREAAGYRKLAALVEDPDT